MTMTSNSPSRWTAAWKRRVADYWNSFSYIGLVSATLFFCASVTPSLIPRPYVAQGLLSAFAIAIGYGLGVLFVHAYRYLELREPRENVQRVSKRITTAVVAIVFVVFLYEMTTWQNSIRLLMEMEPLRSAYPTRVAFIAVGFAMLLVAVSRVVGDVAHWVSEKLHRFIPRRLARLIGFSVTAVFLFFLVNGVIARALLDMADDASLAADRLIEEDIQQPEDPLRTGSTESLIAWSTIGRQGKHFLTLGPSREEISEFLDGPTLQPIRVYAGMDSGESNEDRAQLVLDELIRVDGFDRSVLVVATPTGTGWLDPAGVDTIEYLHAGNTAIVSMQYSYLPSVLTIAVDPTRSIRSARVLFDTIYRHWKTLPKDARPKLYLHGLSLGSLGSELSADLMTVFEDPIQGAVWSGPPFPSRQWAAITAMRNEGSPAWLPTFHDGSVVRFTAQQNHLGTGQRWSPIRCVYIQYASDPMVWFSPELLVNRPEWLDGQRGPDVSPILQWVPIVTSLQMAFDMSLATTVPNGYGHNYSPSSYIDAWGAVTNPPNWSEAQSTRLKVDFGKRDHALSY